MWIGGRRRGYASSLANHLLKTEENERVLVQEIGGFAFDNPTGTSLHKALREMEIVGFAKGSKRNLFHTILAPAYGETLNKAESEFMVRYYAEHMGFVGYQHALVEHWKKGKQHFHLVFNLIDPATGKTHELKHSKYKEWRISRGLEEVFGLSTPKPNGKAIPTWQMQRGKRTGIDPRKVKKDVTAAFKNSITSAEFTNALNKADLTLARGSKNKVVLVDAKGDYHGLARNIEGKNLSDIKRKFPEIFTTILGDSAALAVERKSKTANTDKEKQPEEVKPIDPARVKEHVQNAYRMAQTGAAFFAGINKKGYSIGRTVRGFHIIDEQGGKHQFKDLLGKKDAAGLYRKFADLKAIRPNPLRDALRRQRSKQKTKQKSSFGVSRSGGGISRPPQSTASGIYSSPTRHVTFLTPIRAAFIPAARLLMRSRPERNRVPLKPVKEKKGWPDAAIADWETWGWKFPADFFAKWPELAPDGFVFSAPEPK